MKRLTAVTAVALITCAGAMGAPRYLIDARGWDGEQQARFVVRMMPELVADDAWSGRVTVEGGELLELRARSREGRREAEGVTVDGAGFDVAGGAPMHDVVVELEGGADTRIGVELPTGSSSATVDELHEDDRQLGAGGTPVRMMLTFIYPGEPQPIAELKRLYPRTELVVDGQARYVIAAGDEGQFSEDARRLARAIGRLGAAPEIVAPGDLLDEDLLPSDALSRTHVIALGYVGSNRIIDALWGRQYARAGLLYPGPGGYVVRTAHDPFGLGHNVVVLGGSNAAGVSKAVDRFIETHVAAAEEDLVLDKPIVDVEYHWTELPSVPDWEWEKRMPQVRSEEYLREYCVNAGVMNQAGEIVTVEAEPAAAVQTVIGCLGVFAETWFHLGDKTLPPRMAQMLERNLEAFETSRDMSREHSMSAGITAFAPTWDLIEELPVFSDRMRLAVTNALLSAARQGHEQRAMHTLIREGCRQIHDENHGTNSALQDFRVWQYFDRYYDLPETRYWMEMCDALFRGQAGSFQIPEDAAGYMAYCPNHSMTFAKARPYMDYFRRGVAAEHADYFLLAAVSNLGLYTGFGDTTGLVPVAHFPVFMHALWATGDGRYRWVLDNLLHRNSGLRAYQSWYAIAPDVPAEEPVDLTGICVQPIYPRPVDKGAGRLDPVYLSREPYDDGRFNKICLREAWGADRQYMLLSGMKRDGHTQMDVNCVVNLTDNGKMWLVDHEYGRRAAQDHSGLVAMQDGQYRSPAAQAYVREAADFDRSGLLRTEVRLGDLQWRRNVIWLKGEWFAVLDDLQAGAPAEYFLRASWRGVGDEEPMPDGLRLRLLRGW